MKFAARVPCSKFHAPTAILGALLLPLLAATGACGQSLDDVAIAPEVVLEDRYPIREHHFPNGTVAYADVVFSTIPGYRPLTLDLYVPPGESASGRPVLVMIHGGGWLGGHTRHSGAFSNWPETLAAIAGEGYVVASVEYRLSGEAPFPAAFDDVRAAIRWLRSNADEYGIDRQRAVVMGGSAGGQLAALAGTACGDNRYPDSATAAPDAESACVQGVVTWYGVFDFGMIVPVDEKPDGPDVGGAPGRYLDCGPKSCDADTVRNASAMSFVDAADPPFLMVHGTDDRVVAVEQSRAMHKALTDAGVDSTYIEIPGVNHSFIGQSAEDTIGASRKAFDASIAFIDRIVGSE